MRLYETDEPIEAVLQSRAMAMRRPFGGAMELLPTCNMNCNMCYIRRDGAEILSAEEWIEIGTSLRDAGVLKMLLTGGEPLLHSGFREIYLALQRMGFLLSINTNGTLIDEEWADFFYRNPCKKINITLYGASPETYERLCHYPGGFEKAVHTLKLLKERGVPCQVNMTMVRENREDLQAVSELIRELDLGFTPVTYEFPPLRGGDSEDFERSRMSPREMAEANIERSFLNHADADRPQQARLFFKQLTGEYNPVPPQEGFPCHAGKSGFWIGWEGQLYACGMLSGPAYSLKEYTFEEAWEKLVESIASLKTSEKCRLCRKKFYCPTCAAAMYAETGDTEKAPEFLCEMTDEMIKIMFGYLDDGEKEQMKAAFKACGLIYNF